MQNPEQTVISQYGNSPTLLQLITNFNTYIDPQANLNSFYDDIWNVATAQGYGLDVWGRIVGVQRVLQVPSGTYFGFAEAGDASEFPFNQQPFYSGQTTTGNYALTDAAFRTLIYAKALANICDGSIQAINSILMTLFPGIGNCYVTDGQNMTMTYTFSTVLSPVNYAIVTQSGILPKPAGVALTVVNG